MDDKNRIFFFRIEYNFGLVLWWNISVPTRRTK